MTITRWQRPILSTIDPFEQLLNFREEMNRLFESPMEGSSQAFNTWAPAIDLFEDKDNFFVRAELPGMKKEDIDVSLHEGTLLVSGERKLHEAEGARAHRSERFSGQFQRSVALPTAVASDKVTASYRDGILTITLPKAEEAKPKQIEVSVK